MGKNILVVGSGGREHALCWKIAQSPLVGELWCAPGNAGIALDAKIADIAADDIEALIDFARKESIDLSVVGPELPLTLGIVDSFQDAGLRIFGPTQEAAKLEGSKAFCKKILTEAGVPTPGYRVFDDPTKAVAHVREHEGRVAIKASGLAAGKGVLLPTTMEEAVEAVDRILTRREFGEAGSEMIVEEFLEGEELSIIALCDGERALMFEGSQDHKALLDGDKGPNTGGMGAYSPAPILTPALAKQVKKEILTPTLRALKRAGHPFRGVLYAGLMITEKGPQVLEYNVRFGDPECQPLLMRMKSDLVPLLEASADGSLAKQRVEWHRESAVCVVLTSGGYPGQYATGQLITGLEDVGHDAVKVFHSGTRRDGEGQWLTNGGRVLGVTALGRTLRDALDRAYDNVGRITWEGVHFRTDIAKKGLRRWRQQEEADEAQKSTGTPKRS